MLFSLCPESKRILSKTGQGVKLNLECGDQSPLWSSAAWRRRSFLELKRSMVATGRNRPKRWQVSALQKGPTW